MPTITYSQSTAPTVIDHPLGPPGKSAYQSWLDTGHTGTEQDFMDWLAAGGGGGADLSDDPALPLAATAAAGIGTEASRDDHVHPLPTAAQVGADAAGTATAAVAAHEAEADPHPQYATAAEAAAAAPVQSVAGRTGAVTLTTADVGGLGTAATHAHGDYDLAGAATAAQSAAQTYTDNAVSSAVVGLLDDRGGYDASGNVFPSTGGSGGGGAVLKGDLWTVSVAGTLGGTAVTAGDVVRALTDAPGQTASNWAVTENNLGYVPEPAQTLVTQPEAEAGTDTNRKAWTVQRVWQAIAAWWAGSADKAKLDGIAAGAEVNVNADWSAGSGDALILNKPTLGTAASHDVGDFATAAQGAKADSALQPNAPITGATKTKITYDADGLVTAGADAAPSDVGLGNVTNDAQTKAAVMPNTAPAPGRIPVGNAGGTAYAPVAVSGDATLSSAGALTIGNNKISYAKMQDVSAASKLLGRGDSGSGDPQEITVGSGLTMTGTTLSASGGGGSPGGSDKQLQYNNAGAFGGCSVAYWDAANGRLSVGAGTSPAGKMHAKAGSASEIPMIAQGTTSQTGALQEWRDSSGTVKARVKSDGNLASATRVYINETSYPSSPTYINSANGYGLSFYDAYNASAPAFGCTGGGNLYLGGLAMYSVGNTAYSPQIRYFNLSDGPHSNLLNAGIQPLNVLAIMGLYGGPYASNARHASDIAYWAGHGAQSPTSGDNGGRAGKHRFFLNAGGAGNGAGADGPDGEFEVSTWDTSAKDALTKLFRVLYAGTVFIANSTAPSDTPSGGGYIYIESGALKYKGSSGTVTTLGSA